MPCHFRFFIVLYLLLTGLAIAHAQSTDPALVAYEEILSKAYTSSAHDTVSLSTISDAIDPKNPELADITIDYIQKAIDLAHKTKHTSWEAEYYDKLGWAYITINQKDNSEIAHEKSMKLYESIGDIESRVRIMQTLITSYAVNDAAEKALKLGYKVIELCPNVKDETCLGMTYYFLAKTMYNFDEDEKGIEFAKKAVALLEDTNKTKEVARCYSDYAKYGQYDYEQSLHFMDKSLALIKSDTASTDEDLARLYLSRVLMHEKFDKHNEVEKELNYITVELKDKLSIRRKQNLMMARGKNKYNLGQYQEAIKLLKESVNGEHVDIDPFAYFNYQMLEKSYEKLGQLDSAYHYHAIAREMASDSRVHDSRMKMRELEAKYEAEKKELIIAAQNRELATRKRFEWLAIGGSLLLGLLLLQTYRYAQQKHKTNEKLVELDALKTRLYTNITHEFRTPLTVILGMAAQVKNNPTKYLSSGTALIQKNGERLLGLINQMLDLSKLENGAMTLDNVYSNIITYIRYLSRSVESFASSKNITVHFYPEEDKVMMDYDEEKIKIILTNLFSNAIKFAPEGGNIYIITRTIGPADRPMLKIMFKDTGKGIEEDKLPYIFDRFYQGEAGNTRTGEGSGIGLALVKECVSLMGGTIAVKSKVGLETEFVIVLPITNKAVKKAQSPILHNHISTKSRASKATHELMQLDEHSDMPTILLIEDNLDVATYVASCLDQQYNVIIGHDGREGIEMALHYIPDVIITDIMMPIKDGLQVCQEVKAHQLTRHIPVIMLTAKADYESKLQGLKGGADAYLEKPFAKEELLTRLANLLAYRDEVQQHYLSITSGDRHEETKPKADIPSLEAEFVQTLYHTVSEHISDGSFSVESFAKLVGMSSSQFHRKVSGVTGLSPNRLIRHIRLSRAKTLLTDTSQPVSLIAYATGFSDPGYFSRVFKKEYDMTPIEWRQSNLP